MEATLLAVTPAPTLPPETLTSTPQTPDDASPFTAFLSAAMTASQTPQDETEGTEARDTETPSFFAAQPEIEDDSTPAILPEIEISSQDMLMAAEMAALSLNVIPSQVPLPQPTATILTGGTPISFQDMTAPPVTQLLDQQALSTLPADTLQPQEPVTQTSATSDPFATLLAQEGKMSPEQPTASVNKSEPLLTRQLQNVLTGNSRDTVTIQMPMPQQAAPAETLNTLSSPYLQSVDNTGAALVSTTRTTSAAEKTTTATLAPEETKSLRQNLTEQFMHAKVEAGTENDTAKGRQQGANQQENNATQSSVSTTPLTTTLAGNEQAGSFVLPMPGASAAITSATVAHTAASSATTLPNTQVPGSEIISHLVDRFSVNPRLQTSKISLNLNPAELGSLKIDIMVTGDSIKAHIVANSPQIQETIERHMPKLRTVLEQQGFHIDDFQVSLESAATDSDDFFQQQFTSRDETTAQPQTSGSEVPFDLTLNSAQELLGTATESGINLNI